MMNSRRVVITGLGVVAPNGIGKDEFWGAITEGKSGISTVTQFDVSDLPSKIAGEITHLEPLRYMTSEQNKYLSRQTKFALASAKMAIEDADLDISNANGDERSLILGIMRTPFDL